MIILHFHLLPQFKNELFHILHILQIIGEPSSKMMTEMSETEKKRVAEQIATLSEEGLKSKRQRLEKATDDNEVHCSYVEMFLVILFQAWSPTICFCGRHLK